LLEVRAIIVVDEQRGDLFMTAQFLHFPYISSFVKGVRNGTVPQSMAGHLLRHPS
jgi:hypothetical protein